MSTYLLAKQCDNLSLLSERTTSRIDDCKSLRSPFRLTKRSEFAQFERRTMEKDTDHPLPPVNPPLTFRNEQRFCVDSGRFLSHRSTIHQRTTPRHERIGSSGFASSENPSGFKLTLNQKTISERNLITTRSPNGEMGRKSKPKNFAADFSAKMVFFHSS